MYENNDNSMFCYAFKFHGQDGRLIDSVQNIQDHVLNQAIKKGQYKLVKHKEEEIVLGVAEIIAAVRIGTRKSSSIVSLQFLVS
jgi:hypothetical protein